MGEGVEFCSKLGFFFVNFFFDNNDYSNPIICGCYLVEVVIYSK